MINLQINNKAKIKIAGGLFATFLICLFAYSVARAQQVLPLTVIPPKQEVLINPGEHFSTSVKFLNQGDTPISGTISVEDFVVTDDNGTPVFIDNPKVVGTTTIPAKYSAAKWINIPQDNLVLPAKGNGSVEIAINVPKNAAPGGRYAAVLFQPSGSLTLGNPASAQETPIAIRLASLLYIRVSGPITEKASVIKFSAPGFLEYGPVGITTQILNEGDYHITPKGTITLKDMFGFEVGNSALDAKNIFPGTTRTYSNDLGTKLMFGKFTANLTATYGEKGQLLTSSFVVWLFPWRVTLAIILGIVIIILIINLWYKRIVKRERKLTEELKAETTELEALKEKYKDRIPPAPPTQSVPPTNPS